MQLGGKRGKQPAASLAGPASVGISTTIGTAVPAKIPERSHEDPLAQARAPVGPASVNSSASHAATEESPSVESRASSSEGDLTDRAAVLASWKRRQEEMRAPLAEQGLVRQPVFGFLEGDANSDAGRSIDVELATPVEGDPNAALTQMVDMHRLLAENLLRGAKRIGDDCMAEGLKVLALPSFLEEIGDNFSAPKLRELDVPAPVSRLDIRNAEPIQPGQFRRFGDNFSAPSLENLRFEKYAHFVGFGRNFHAPSLVALAIKDCPRFEEFPEDLRLPSLVNVDLKGCANFRGFPARFFDGANDLRNIELLGTRVRYHDLPTAIRNNPDIHIDIRPVGDLPLGGAQSTHLASVHFSSSESARRVVENVGDFDVGEEFQDICDHVNKLPNDAVPEGLQPYIDGPLPDLLAHIHPLDARHAHRQYFTSEVNAAKRAVFGQLPHHDAVDPHSQVALSTYAAACWRLMKDPGQRWERVELETGRAKFVRMLYEIQRGDNLRGEERKDNGDPRDVTICFGGPFNKVTDRMNGILKAVELIVSTEKMIQMKTDAAIKQQVRAMLDDGLPLSEFTQPDEDGEIFCSPALAQRIQETVFSGLAQHFRLENEPSRDWELRTARIAGFLEYQLAETDMSELIQGAKGKGKASMVADE